MPTSLGPAEILVILVVALLVLGPNRLPQAGRQVGRALAEVRRWSSSIKDEIRDVIESEPDPPPVPADPGQAKITGDPVPQATSPAVAGELPARGEDTEASPQPPGPTAPTNGSAADPPRN